AVITNFTERNSQSSYWETGELPDINLMKDSVFLILDQEGYYKSQEQSFGNAAGNGDGPGNPGESQPSQPVKKHAV
ncbi:ABC transporter permease, partial [[Clostridium] symbiosum]|nr:ABC transporter permease [[Clostridium] symbiosum]